ncbi:hypothetical protein P691DRAFT_761994 [Macrolepiota fuliginosa MF-IS2]|uniref:Uncharacterized protein n=1 Tax=Macrolepiota fuliginosa MF-IS2 TaxID=1400762 RepID=A0A9P5X7P4_9AGAR|nr:hypothetical protein P691DRAFT_761994 [Macrolepiota fuliginosa MF-IS2]
MALIPRELNGLHDGTMCMAEIFLCSLLAGSLITLGISCVILLAREKERMSKQHRLLRIYVIALLFLIVSLEVEIFLGTGSNVAPCFWSPRKVQEYSDLVMFLGYLTVLAVYALTDGLLVWRCFMIYRGLRHSLLANHGRVVWIFPACLLGLGLVAGCIACGVRLQYRALSDKFVSGAFASDVVLNLYATILITATLLRYRRTVKSLSACTPSTPAQHLPIIAILLESAATNAPGAIVVAVGVGIREDYGVIFAPTVAMNQALTSVLIIHQVALGRAFRHRGEEEVKSMAPLAFRGCEGNGQGLSDHGV